MEKLSKNFEAFHSRLLDADCLIQIKEDEDIAKEFDIHIEEFWRFLSSKNFCNQTIKNYFEILSLGKQQDYFNFAIGCVCAFIQANFTGPDLDEKFDELIKSVGVDNAHCNKLLAINNEDINVNTKYSCLLVAAEAIFKNILIHPLLNSWWQWRCIFLHQKILEELSPSLLSRAEQLQKEISKLIIINELEALFEVEQVQLYCEFRNVIKADNHIREACTQMGLHYELFGKLGKRTKHQINDIAQLTLEVNVMNKDSKDREQMPEMEVPQNVRLDDDVRFDTIKFSSETKHEAFSNLEQKLILVLAQHMLISKPQDDLFYEEMKPFIDILLAQNSTWCVRMCTLLLRCKMESKQNRTVERSLMQCEELITAMKKKEPCMFSRVGDVFSTGLSPVWKTQQQYADLMLNLGMVKTALDVYLSIQLWEEVIVCYTILKCRHKAAEIIKEQLEIKPTVKLLCLLGDATDDVTCYEKAWEMSKRRSHRAQRHWGQYYFMRKQYLECIPHFEKSVSINPLQGIVWLRLGFAALETQNWQVAATAYRRYTTLEPDAFEAWNNLAQAYIKLGNKRNAHHALQDALRCNFDNWKVWENFLVVSMDIASFSYVIRAYHKLLDLKEKYLNIDVLKIFVIQLCNLYHANESDAATELLIKRARELFGRLTTIYPGEAILWELYAKLAPDAVLKVQRLQKALRCFCQDSSWIKDLDVCEHVLSLCVELGEGVLNDAIKANDTLIFSARLNISSAITAFKKCDYPDTKKMIMPATLILNKVIDKTKTLPPLN